MQLTRQTVDPSSDGTHLPNHTLHHLCLVPIYCALCALFPFCTSYLAAFPTLLWCTPYPGSIPYYALVRILPMLYSYTCHYGISYPGSIPYPALYSHPITAVFPTLPHAHLTHAVLTYPALAHILLLTTHSVRYHSLSSTTSFRLQACYGLLPARPGQATWRVGSKVYVCWSVVMKYIVPPPPAANSLEKNATQYKIFLKLILQPKFQLRGRRV